MFLETQRLKSLVLKSRLQELPVTNKQLFLGKLVSHPEWRKIPMERDVLC